MRGFVAAAFGLALTATASAAVTVAVTPATTNVKVGDSFSVSLVASGATAGIGAWDFLLTASLPGRVTLTGVTFSSALGSIPSEALSFSSGSEFGVVSLLASADLITRQQGSLTLATLTFTAAAAGTTQLSLVAPPLGAMMADAAGLSIVPGVTAGLVNVSAVPEVGTSLLMVLGSGGLLAWSGWRRRTAGFDGMA